MYQVILIAFLTVSVICWNQGDFLNSIDTCLFERMKEPDEESPRVILNYISDYNEGLIDLIHKLSQKNNESDPAALSLLTKKTPRFDVSNIFKTDELSKVYKWSSTEIDELTESLKLTSQLWIDFKKASSHIEIPKTGEEETLI